MSQKKHFNNKTKSSIPFLSETLEKTITLSNTPKIIYKEEKKRPPMLYKKINPIIRRRIINQQYNTFKPKFKNENLTPLERKKIELSDSQDWSHLKSNKSLSIKTSNSLGYFSRVKSLNNIRNDNKTKINRLSPNLLKEHEDLARNYRNISKSKIIDFYKSDIFNSKNNNEHKRRNYTACSSSYNLFKSSKPTATKKKNSYNEDSLLEKEVNERYQDRISRQRKYLNLTSKLDNYSMNAPKILNNIEYQIKATPKKDITKLKRLFSSSAIHIFNIVDNSSTTNPNENIYNLKIRIDPTSTKEQNQIKRIKYKLHFSGSKISLVKKK